jgi:hypothetical protein
MDAYESEISQISPNLIRRIFQEEISSRGPVQPGDCYIMIFPSLVALIQRFRNEVESNIHPTILRESFLSSQHLFFDPLGIVGAYPILKGYLSNSTYIPVVTAIDFDDRVESKMCSIFTLKSLQKEFIP